MTTVVSRPSSSENTQDITIASGTLDRGAISKTVEICKKFLANSLDVPSKSIEGHWEEVIDLTHDLTRNPLSAIRDKVALVIIKCMPEFSSYHVQTLNELITPFESELPEFKQLGTQISNWSKGQLQKVEQIADAIFNPTLQAEHYAQVAFRYAQLGDRAKAQAILDKAPQIDPHDRNRIFTQIGCSLLRQGEIEKGVEIITLLSMAGAHEALLAKLNLELALAYLRYTPANIEAATQTIRNTKGYHHEALLAELNLELALAYLRCTPANIEAATQAIRNTKGYNNEARISEMVTALLRCNQIPLVVEIINKMKPGEHLEDLLLQVIPILTETKELNTALQMIQLLDNNVPLNKDPRGNYYERIITLLLPHSLDEAIKVALLTKYHYKNSRRVLSVIVPLLMGSKRTAEAINLTVALLNHTDMLNIMLPPILQKLLEQVKPGTALIDLIPLKELSDESRYCLVHALLQIEMPEVATKAAEYIEDSQRYQAFFNIGLFYLGQDKAEEAEKIFDQMGIGSYKGDLFDRLVSVFEKTEKKEAILRLAKKMLETAHSCPEAQASWKKDFLDRAANGFWISGDTLKTQEVGIEMLSIRENTKAYRILGKILTSFWNDPVKTEKWLTELGPTIQKDCVVSEAVLSLSRTTSSATIEVQKAISSIRSPIHRLELFSSWLREDNADLSIPLLIAGGTAESAQKSKMCNIIINICVRKGDGKSLETARNVIAKLQMDKGQMILKRIADYVLNFPRIYWKDLSEAEGFYYWPEPGERVTTNFSAFPYSSGYPHSSSVSRPPFTQYSYFNV